MASFTGGEKPITLYLSEPNQERGLKMDREDILKKIKEFLSQFDNAEIENIWLEVGYRDDINNNYYEIEKLEIKDY